MNLKSKLSLLIAISLGILTMLILHSYINNIKLSVHKETELVQAVVAKKNIQKGTLLEKSLISARKIPAKFLPGDAILARDYEIILNQPLEIPVKAGEPLLWSHLGVEQKGTLSANIQEKKRAVTIGVDELTGIGGMIVPYDHVDILLTFTPLRNESSTSGIPQAATITLLQDVPVIAVGRNIFEYQSASPLQQGYGYSSVTLSVSPLDAELLVFAQEHGSISLTLRNPEDRGKEEIPEINFEYLTKEFSR